MNIILQPCANHGARQHYRDTIANLVPLKKHADLLFPIEVRLQKLFPKGNAPIWGVTPGANGQNEKKFKRATEGDVVLFARDGHIISTAILALKFHSSTLAHRLWGQDEDGQTWEYIYFLDEIKTTKIPYAEFNAVVGYAPNFVIQGFSVLDEPKSERVIEHFGLSSVKHSPPTSTQEYRNTIDQLAGMEQTERVVQAFARKEQAYLRQHLFNAPNHHCAICGQEFPVNLLVAAHIKRRAACCREEKLDADNIIMPVCKFGCDELYEQGYIAVDEDGKLVVAQQETTAALKEFLDAICGRSCMAFKVSNAKYFAWHKKAIFRQQKDE